MTIEQLREKNLIVFEAIVGSRAYNLNDENSDTDIFGVYILPNAKVLGDSVDTTYNEAGIEISQRGKCIRTNDTASKVQGTYIEIRDYLRQLAQGSPQAIETLFLTDECILYVDEDFKKLVLKQRQRFITSKLKYTFCYSPLRLLREHQIWRAFPEREVKDFFKVLPDSIGDVRTLREFFQHYPSHPNAWALEAIKGAPNIYKMYVSYTAETDLKLGKQTYAIYPGFSLNEQNAVITIKKDNRSEVQRRWPLAYRNNVYFDKESYDKYITLKKGALKRGIDPTNKDVDFRFAYDGKALAHCYRIIKFGLQLISTKDLDLRFDQPTMYKEIRTNCTPFSTLEFNFKGAKIAFENALKETTIDVEVSRDLLSEIELTLRSRKELTRAIGNILT